MVFSLFVFFLFQDYGFVETKTLQVGHGESAISGTELSVHYIGMLTNGKEFDNSYKRGEPIKVILDKSQVIKGWHLGLTGVKKGEKRLLTIPPKYGYGDRAIPNIPANSVLIFEVEIVDLVLPESTWSTTGLKETKRDLVTFYTVSEGKGKAATKGSKITYHYNLYDKSGTKIYSSFTENNPEEIRLGEKRHLIQGLETGLYGAKQGEKRKLVCKGPVGNEEDLYIFDLEVVKISN
jgi:FKBP-type peptidyl-prolyl cis-trans isomerase